MVQMMDVFLGALWARTSSFPASVAIPLVRWTRALCAEPKHPCTTRIHGPRIVRSWSRPPPRRRSTWTSFRVGREGEWHGSMLGGKVGPGSKGPQGRRIETNTRTYGTWGWRTKPFQLCEGGYGDATHGRPTRHEHPSSLDPAQLRAASDKGPLCIESKRQNPIGNDAGENRTAGAFLHLPPPNVARETQPPEMPREGMKGS